MIINNLKALIDKLIVTFACVFFIVNIGFTFGQETPAVNFDTREGLPSSEVYDVEVDQYGQVWMTTDRGACLYDGYEFKSFGTGDGLATTTNFKIYRDLNDRFWFTGMDGSLSHWNGRNFAVSVWSDRIRELLPSGQWLLQAGMNKKGELLFSYGAAGGNICKFLRPGSSKVYDVDWDSLASVYPSWRYRQTSLIELPNTIFSSWEMSEAVTSLDRRYLYCAKRWPEGIHNLIRLDRTDSLSVTTIRLPERILDIYVSDNDDVWVGTTGGLFRFQKGDLSRPPRKYFAGMALSAITRDPEGNFWIATLSNGVLFVPSFGFEQMPLITSANQSPISLLGMDHHLLVGTQEGQILALDTLGNETMLVHRPAFFGMYKNGTRRENRARFVAVSFHETDTGLVLAREDLARYTSTQAMELASGKIFQSGRTGFQLMTPEGQTLQKSDSTFSLRVFSAIECGKDVWIGSIKGLYRCRNGNFSKVEKVYPENENLNVRINDLCNDGHENVWAATIGNGLFYLTGDQIFQISGKGKLSSDLINTIFSVNDSTLLVGSNRGLDLLHYRGGKDFQLKSIQSIGPEDGLWGQFVRDVVYWRDQVWLATNKGLLHFGLQQMVPSPIPPPRIMIKSVQVDHKSMREQQRLRLRHDQNNLVFHFSGISQRKPPESSFYRFRLVRDGIAGEWNFTNDRSVQYYNLASGHYQFVAMARNDRGDWSDEPIVYEFRIRPHFSQTLWFQALVIASLVALVALVFLWYRRRLRRKEAAQRKLSEVKLRVQAAEIAALRNQINPHFIFNVLNSIQNFYVQNDLENANRYLVKFSRLMRDGLQFSNRQWISLQTELDFLNTYLELEQMRFPEKFSFAMKIDPDIDPHSSFLPPFLFQPILENAIKHGFKEIQYPGKLEISIRASEEEEFFDITIEDNGPGLNPASAHNPRIESPGPRQSFGIDLVRHQIQLLNAESGAGNAGFYLEDLRLTGPNFHGVRAVFRIPIKYQIPA